MMTPLAHQATEDGSESAADPATPPTFFIPEHISRARDTTRDVLTIEHAWLKRATLATALLDVAALEALAKEIDAYGGLNPWPEVCWHAALHATLNHVKAYIRMVEEPRRARRWAELEHELQLKDKDIELRRLELEVEQTRLEREDRERQAVREQDERERQAEREYQLRKRRLDSVDATIKAVILAQAEFRDNPLAEELVGRFRGIYDTLDQMGYKVELDEEAMRDLIEQIALRHFTKQTGIKVE